MNIRTEPQGSFILHKIKIAPAQIPGKGHDMIERIIDLFMHNRILQLVVVAGYHNPEFRVAFRVA